MTNWSINNKEQHQNGDYTTDICKNQNEWIIYNEDSLGLIDYPLSKNAYLLFYRRKDIS